MPSKRSFFSKTLFKKHLSRFWPLWGGVSLVGAMFPLYMLLALVQHTLGFVGESNEFRSGLYQITTGFVPAFTCFYAILCVMAVWGYLYNARAVGLMHTLPVDRTCLFVTNTLAALAMILIPYAVVGGLICLIALGWGFFDLTAVLATVASVLFIALLFTGMATLCAMLTGHGFVLPAFYLLANFLAFAMEMLVTNLAHEFLLGVPMSEGLGRLTFLSPVVEIYQKFRVYLERDVEANLTACDLRGLWVVALYALAGLAMLALSWLLYKLRHSESAGDVVAFRWLRPVFRYGVALLSGLTIGRLLYELLWHFTFQQNGYADELPMAVCIFLGAVVGYYAASMLLEKSRRVFGKKSLPGLGIVAAGTVALCLLVSVDVFGLEKRVPALDEIESVTFESGWESGPFSAAENPDQVEALRELHQAIVADRNYIRAYVPNWNYEQDVPICYSVYLTYQLKDGSTLRRVYSLWLTGGRMETAGTYDNLLAAFCQDPVVRLDSVTVPGGTELESIDVFLLTGNHYTSVNTNDHAEGDDRETQQIYAALQKDGLEGNIPALNVLWYSDGRFHLGLNCVMPDASGRARIYAYKQVYLAPSMTNTIETLVELGYVTEEEVEQWEKNLAEQNAAVG